MFVQLVELLQHEPMEVARQFLVAAVVAILEVG